MSIIIYLCFKCIDVCWKIFFYRLHLKAESSIGFPPVCSLAFCWTSFLWNFHLILRRMNWIELVRCQQIARVLVVSVYGYVIVEDIIGLCTIFLWTYPRNVHGCYFLNLEFDTNNHVDVIGIYVSYLDNVLLNKTVFMRVFRPNVSYCS